MVNVEPLRALTGDPTAAWMEQALVQALPQALGPHLAPGDRNAPVLEVRIDWIYLAPSPGGPGPRGSAQDTIIGSFLVRGPRGGIEPEIPLRAIASYYPSAVDQALVERAYHGRMVDAWRRPSRAGRRGSSGFRRALLAVAIASAAAVL